MKKLISFVLTAVSIICVCSCGNQSSSDLQAKVDSLQTALSQRDADYRTLDEFVNVISTGLDSIAIQETELFNPSKESPTPSQEQIKKQLSHFKETLQSQRERIAELEKKLGNSEGNGKKLQRSWRRKRARLLPCRKKSTTTTSPLTTCVVASFVSLRRMSPSEPPSTRRTRPSWIRTTSCTRPTSSSARKLS